MQGGWEGGGVGNSQRSYDRWALGEGGEGQGQGEGELGRGAGAGGGGGEEREGGWVGAGPARGVGGGERGEEEREGGPSSGPVRPAQHKARGLTTGLKTN